MELDNHNRPTHRIKHQNWSAHLHQLKQGKSATGQFNYEAGLIADHAATYLTNRSKRAAGSGRAGDLLEQFIGEWVYFAANDLPTFKFTHDSMAKFNQRIRYIEQIQKHENLFRFGSFSRAKNKFDTLQSIKEQLLICLHKTKQEELRRCARDEFETCRTDTAALLLACVQSLYYARGTDVHSEPFDLSIYIDPDDRHTSKDANHLYPIIKKTHTGAMLYEVIRVAGLESFGTVNKYRLKPSPTLYFDPQFQTRPIDWQKKSADLPYWVAKESEVFHLNEFQKFCHSLLKVSELKRLIEEGYDLTGNVGNLWAYGDKQGKKSLEALLFLMETELDELKKKFDNLYAFHNTQRLAYNLKNKIDAIKGVNPNFNKVDEQQESIEKLYDSLKKSIQKIHEEMDKYPEDAINKIDQKKKGFYHSITKYLKQFHPNSLSQYSLLEEAVREKETSKIKHPAPHEEKIEIDFNLSFKMQVQSSQTMSWKMGDSYSDWTASYFARHKQDFDNYHLLANDLSHAISQTISIAHLQQAETRLIQQVNFIKSKLEGERPKWRFQGSFWPVQTAGWPFNRAARRLAGVVDNELSIMHAKIKQASAAAENTFLTKPTDSEIKKLLERHNENNKKHEALINEKAVTSVMVESKPEIPADNLIFAHKGDLFDALYDFVIESLNNCRDAKTELVFFAKQEEATQSLQSLLKYRDQLNPEAAQLIIESTLELIDVVHLQMKLNAFAQTSTSFEQGKLLLSLLNVFTTSKISDDRKDKLAEFENDCIAVFARMKLNQAISGTNRR